MTQQQCPNSACQSSSNPELKAVIRYGFYRIRFGRRRRFLCRCCHHTFCSTRETVYYRLQHRRSTFDAVAVLSVEGANKSFIARAVSLYYRQDIICLILQHMDAPRVPIFSRVTMAIFLIFWERKAPAREIAPLSLAA